MKPMTVCRTLIVLVGLTLTQLAFAHGGHGESGIAGGLDHHSLAGPEHVLALIGFGAWAVLTFRGTAWRLLAATLCAIALGCFTGWLAPDGVMSDSLSVAWLLGVGLLIALRDRLNLIAVTAALIMLAAVKAYAHAAVGHGIGNPAGFVLGTIWVSALLMAIGASLGGALRVDRAVQAGGLRSPVPHRIVSGRA